MFIISFRQGYIQQENRPELNAVWNLLSLEVPSEPGEFVKKGEAVDLDNNGDFGIIGIT